MVGAVSRFSALFFLFISFSLSQVLPMIRSWGTTPVMFLLCYSQDRNFWRISKRDLFGCALLGLIVCCGCQNLFNLGLMLTTAADGGITQPAIPVFAAFMAIL